MIRTLVTACCFASLMLLAATSAAAQDQPQSSDEPTIRSPSDLAPPTAESPSDVAPSPPSHEPPAVEGCRPQPVCCRPRRHFFRCFRRRGC